MAQAGSGMKAALVTGADRGVGLALAEALLQRGVEVFAGRYDRSGTWNGLQELERTYGSRLHLVELDVSDDASVRRAVAEAAEKGCRSLDLLINNAAILGDRVKTVQDELTESDYTEMQQVFNVNTLGALRMSQTFLPLLLAGERRQIVNISSEAGSIGASYRTSWFAYTMSKAALNMQSALIHNQIRPLGGQVLVMHPGWVRTHMQGKLDAGADYEPMESALRILQQADRFAAEPVEEHPVFVDVEGKRWPW